MNILFDALPKTVTISGREIAVRFDFRPSLQTLTAFEDDSLTQNEKAQILLFNLYPEIPADTSAALERAQWFLNGGDSSPTAHAARDKGEPRAYSFVKDARFIYAAFRQTHGIDLQTAQLHWWEFLALFWDLGQDTTFCQLAALRKRVKTGKASKEERRAAQEMGDVFTLPELDTRTLADLKVEKSFDELLKKGETWHTTVQSA
jgi:hypothetical protein